MEKEHKVCTLSQAMELIKSGLILDTECYWIKLLGDWYLKSYPFYDEAIEVNESIAAPNSDELSYILPPDIKVNGQTYSLLFIKTVRDGKEVYACEVVDGFDRNDWYFDFQSDHLSWLMADVLIWLIKNDHFKVL